MLQEDTFDNIEKNNPYKIESQDNDENMFPEDLVRQAFNLQRKAYLVKFLAILDFVSNIMYGFYGYFMYIIFAACSFAGYMSTVTYNRSLLLCYLIYQFIQITFKGSSFILITILACSSDLRKQIENHTNSSDTFSDLENINYGIMIPLSGLLLIVQVVITIYIFDFYKHLPTRLAIRNLLV